MSSRSGSSGLTAGSCSANSSSSPIRPRRRSGVARRQLPARCSYLARTAVTFKRHAPLNRNEPPTSRSPAGRDRLSVAAVGDARSNWRSFCAHWLTVGHKSCVSGQSRASDCRNTNAVAPGCRSLEHKCPAAGAAHSGVVVVRPNPTSRRNSLNVAKRSTRSKDL